jgi:histone H3/H4
MKFESATQAATNEIWKAIEPKVGSSGFLEEAAQALTSQLYSTFEESMVIARVFVTVPFGELPAVNKKFVENLASGSAGALKPTTPVLSLIGTSGAQADWNDRRKSRGHAGIPLISAEFVAAIPMISRLLKELGVPLGWVDSHDASMVVEAIGSSTGLFFVDDASQAVDQHGRKIIAAQDFVSASGLKSVFGLGGAYENGQILVVIAFCRDRLKRETAERFIGLVERFKAATGNLAAPAKVFAS